MLIAVDSAENMMYSGTLSGSFQDVQKVYEELAKIFQISNIRPPFHWRMIRRKVKDAAMSKIANAINGSRLVINIFEHERIPKLERKILFYEILPQHISLRISPWIKELAGTLQIEVDDDYRAGGSGTSTKRFVKSLVENICFVAVGKQIDSRVEINTVKATIKLKKGDLRIYGNVTKSSDSKAIQIIDIVLGYYIQYKCRQFDRNKLHYWKVFRK